MKRFWSLLLVLLLIPCLIVAASAEETSTSGTCGKNARWQFEEERGVLTISGSGDTDNFRYLETEWDFDYLAEEPWYPLRNGITTVVVEKGITGIGNYAFADCKNLTDVRLSDTVTKIGWYAFSNSDALKEIRLPDSITWMDSHVFDNCEGLEKVTLPKNLKKIPKFLFFQCTSLEEVRIPNKVTAVEDYAFFQSGVKKVVLGERVKTIGDQTFSKNKKLTEISFPAALESIAEGAFRESRALKTVTYGGTVKERDGLKIGYDNGELLAAQWICSDGTVESSLQAPVIEWGKAKGATGKPILEWEKSYDPATKSYSIYKYRVYRSEKENSGFTSLGSFSKYTFKEYSFTDKTAEAGKTYYYRIKAVSPKTGKVSGFSNTVKVTCRLAPPDFTVDENDDTGVTEIRWKTVKGAVKYRVYRADGQAGPYKCIHTAIKGRVYRDTSAKVGETYFYKVKAVHENTDANSLTAREQRGRRKLPPPEIEVTLTRNGDPKVTWETVKGGAKYQVYRCTSEYGTYDLVKTAKESRTFVDKKAKAGQRYYYTVRVQDRSGGWSECAWAKSVKAK